MAAPVLPNPDALAALAAPPVAPPVIPPAPAQPAPAAVGGVAQAAQAAPVQQEEVCLACSFFPYSAYFSCFAVFSFSLVFLFSVVCFILHHVFFSFSLVSSRLSPISVPFPVYSIVACQFARQFLFLFISRRVFCLNLVLCCPLDRLLLFAVRASVFSVSRVFGCYKCLAVCSAVTNVWPCVRLLEVFGRGFGCYKSWACVGLLEVFGRVFGCYKCFVVCSAVSSVWPCVRLFPSGWPCVRLLQVFGRVFGCYNFWPCARLLQALAVRSAVSSVGQFRFCYFLHAFISTLFYLFRALPIHFFSRAFFFLVGPSVLFMHVFSHAHIFSRSFCSSTHFFIIVRLSLCIRFSFTFAACLFCFVFVVIFVFFCFPRSLGVCFSFHI